MGIGWIVLNYLSLIHFNHCLSFSFYSFLWKCILSYFFEFLCIMQSTLLSTCLYSCLYYSILAHPIQYLSILNLPNNFNSCLNITVSQKSVVIHFIDFPSKKSNKRSHFDQPNCLLYVCTYHSSIFLLFKFHLKLQFHFFAWLYNLTKSY